MRQSFCEYCMKENEYKVHKVNKISILNNEEINYKAKEAICKKCGNEILVSDICDFNLEKLYEEYKKKHNIVSAKVIQRIINKYRINEYSLSRLLGWNDETVSRYLDGDMIINSHSDMIEKIYENVSYYSMILQNNEGRIEPVDYNKSRQAVEKSLSQESTEEKIDSVIKYILIRGEDFTPYTLHKLLYYVQAFYYVFTNKFLFNEDCEAFTNGPVFRSLCERYEIFGYEETNKDILANNKLKLDNVERNVVESIIKFYGCYSEKILRQMIQNEAPWIFTRINLINKEDFEDNNYDGIIEKNLIAEYFNGIKEKYHMTNLLDIEKYSKDLFNNMSM